MELKLSEKKILLISSGQPSLNPRLVKEADALSDAGYDVTVLYAYWNDWGTKYDEQLLAKKTWKAIRAGGDPQQGRQTYFLSKVIYKLAKTLFKLTNNSSLADFGVARAAYPLIRAAKKQQADLYIAHNLGALPAAVKAAKTNNKPCGFDAEDFHRYETSDDITNADVALKTIVENKYIPRVNYFTASSAPIANAYRQIFPKLTPVVLLNVFPKSTVVANEKKTIEPLKLFWFSQTIGDNRGITDGVAALQLLDKSHFELNLLGSKLHSNPAFIEELSNSGINLKFHEPIAQDELIQFSAQFDIGLALEPAFSTNNNLALSNKLFTYLQAGLAIIASDTTAQQNFMDQNPQIGHTYPKGNARALAAILLDYYQHRNKLFTCKKNALQQAHEKYNWEMESSKFLALVKEALSA